MADAKQQKTLTSAKAKELKLEAGKYAGINAPFGARLWINADSVLFEKPEILDKVAAELKKDSSDLVRLADTKSDNVKSILVRKKDGTYGHAYIYIRYYKGKGQKKVTVDDIDF